MSVKKRCPRCRQYLREDGTCKNPNCIRYVPKTSTDKSKVEESGEIP